MKETYRHMNESILPPENLKEQVFAKLEKPKRPKRLRPLTAALILVLMIWAGPVTVSAAMTAVTDLMYPVSPETAARFSPIQKADTENGIRMEVVSAAVQGAETEVYVTFQDLKGDRLNGEMIFLDGNLYRRGSGSEYLNRHGHYEVLDFDPEKGIQTVMEGVRHEPSSGKPGEDPFAQENPNEKLMYVVEEIQLITEKIIQEVPYISGKAAIQERRKGELPIVGCGGNEAWVKQESYRLLASEEPIAALYPGVDVMAMGFIDGAFHVQVRESSGEQDQNLSYGVRLFDEAGNSLFWENGITYTDEAGNQRSEWVFLISEEEIKGYTPVFDLNCIQTIEGPWRVTFPVTK